MLNALCYAVLLAWNFDIRANRTEITVPNVESGSDFSIVCQYHAQHAMHSTYGRMYAPPVFGDSTNWSEQFTINGPNW